MEIENSKEIEKLLVQSTTTDSDMVDSNSLSKDSLDKLVKGVMSQMQPQYEASQATLRDVCKSQHILIETVQAENAKFDDCSALKEVIQVMEQAKLYHNKLLTIKKDMSMLHEKSAKMKSRALKLQQQKQKEALQKEADRERQLEKERALIALPASSKQ